MSVEFEENDLMDMHRRRLIGDEAQEGGFLTKMLLRSGLVQDKKQADFVLAGIAVMFFVFTIITFIKS